MQIPKLSLCAIVRDEVQNPAGGIADFLAWTLPFVEQAIVVDTGSIDGTREVLDEARRYYPHLQVQDHPFDGFAASRNYALEQVGTEWVLVLDADERLWPSDFAFLYKCLTIQKERDAFQVGFNHILPWNNSRMQEFIFIESMSVRIFKAGKGFVYLQRTEGYLRSSENLYVLPPHTPMWAAIPSPFNAFVKAYDTDDKEGFRWCQDISRDLQISHFKPNFEGRQSKKEELYEARILGDIPPASTPSFAKWKEVNSKRLQFGPILQLGESPKRESSFLKSLKNILHA